MKTYLGCWMTGEGCFGRHVLFKDNIYISQKLREPSLHYLMIRYSFNGKLLMADMTCLIGLFGSA